MNRARASDRYLATVLFTDIVESTELASRLGDLAWRDLLEVHHAAVRQALRAARGVEIDTAGDGFFASFDAPARAVACGLEISRVAETHGLQVRCGIHVGEVEQIGAKVGGIAVHIGARVAAIAAPGEVLVTAAVRDMSTGSAVRFEERGLTQLKGVPGDWTLYAAVAPDSSAPVSSEVRDELRSAAVRRFREAPIWRRRPRVTAALVLILAVVIAGTGLYVWAPWRPAALAAVTEDGIGIVDPERRAIIGEVKVGGRPEGIAFGAGAAWVANAADGTVSRVAIDRQAVIDTIEVGRDPAGIAVGHGSVWVANSGDGTVSRINPETGRVVDAISVGSGPTGIAIGRDAVWVTNTHDASVTRIDAQTGMAGEPLGISASPGAIVADDTQIWVAHSDGAVVSRLDPSTGTAVVVVPVGGSPTDLAIGGGSVWVLNRGDGTVSRIDSGDNRVTDVVEVGGAPTGISVQGDTVWVAGGLDGTLIRFPIADPTSLERLATASSPQDIAVVDGHIWFSTHAARERHRGGTLRVTALQAPILDPATAVGAGLLSLTSDGLVGFLRVGGVQGAGLAAVLAETIPQASDGGTTYVFRLRLDLVYSNSQPVRAQDFRTAIQRVFEVPDPLFGGPSFGSQSYGRLVGAAACAEVAPAPNCDLAAGIVTDDQARTVTFHLTEADPGFLHALAQTFASPLPTESIPTTLPITTPLPATGPYMVSSISDTEVRLIRNPHFLALPGDVRPDGFADEIVWSIGVDATEQVDLVAAGEADWMEDRVPADRVTELSTRYTPQLHNSYLGTVMAFFNSSLPPFDLVEVRRAVNLAIDRDAVAAAYGGVGQTVVTCQMLPPNFPGYRPYCPYTAGSQLAGVWSAPDLRMAQRMVIESGTAGMQVVVGPIFPERPDHAAFAGYLVELLNELGYDASFVIAEDRPAAFDALFGGTMQMGLFEWNANYPAPSQFLGQFRCGPDPYIYGLCDQVLDEQIGEAIALEPLDATAALERWAGVDRAVSDLAIVAPVLSLLDTDFVSDRVGNYQFHPQWGFLLDQAWVQ